MRWKSFVIIPYYLSHYLFIYIFYLTFLLEKDPRQLTTVKVNKVENREYTVVVNVIKRQHLKLTTSKEPSSIISDQNIYVVVLSCTYVVTFQIYYLDFFLFTFGFLTLAIQCFLHSSSSHLAILHYLSISLVKEN